MCTLQVGSQNLELWYMCTKDYNDIENICLVSVKYSNYCYFLKFPVFFFSNGAYYPKTVAPYFHSQTESNPYVSYIGLW